MPLVLQKGNLKQKSPFLQATNKRLPTKISGLRYLPQNHARCKNKRIHTWPAIQGKIHPR